MAAGIEAGSPWAEAVMAGSYLSAAGLEDPQTDFQLADHSHTGSAVLAALIAAVTSD